MIRKSRTHHQIPEDTHKIIFEILVVCFILRELLIFIKEYKVIYLDILREHLENSLTTEDLTAP